jgi:hydroxymethylpyrimidine pyrophosphatase-like HAD family hydrolase
MLKEANFSFAMQNAHQDIINIANYTTDNSNDDFGVEKTLELLIKSNAK